MQVKFCELKECPDFEPGIIKKYSQCGVLKKTIQDILKEECPKEKGVRR